MIMQVFDECIITRFTTLLSTFPPDPFQNKNAVSPIYHHFRVGIFTYHSEYDHKSIMHYGGKKKDCVRLVNEPYMTLKPSNQEIPENP